MIGLGVLAMVFALLMVWGVRGGRTPARKAWLWMAVAVPLLPVAANSFGWIFTEMGRQPWVVFGLMTTANAVSPGVSAGEVWTSVITFTVLYAVLAVIEIGLMLHFIKRGADPFEEPPNVRLGGDSEDKPLVHAY